MQTAGHEGAFQFFEDKIIKKCKSYELKFYQQVNESKNELDLQFQRFIPKFFGQVDNQLIIQNLLQKHESASYIDVKIGKQIKLNSNNDIEGKLNKERQTFTHANFFRFSGFILKDKNGQIIETMFKKVPLIQNQDIQYIKEEQKIIYIIQKLLKSNQYNFIPQEIFDQLLEQLDDIIYFFENFSYYRFVSSSLFIVIDNINQNVICKMIDLTHYEKLIDNQRDDNYLEGIHRFKHYLILAKQQDDSQKQ